MPTRARPKFVYFDRPVLPRPVVDRLVGDLEPISREQRRQIAVHGREEGQPEEGVAVVGLDAAAGVRAVVLEHPVRNPLAKREAKRREPVALREVRTPLTSAGPGVPGGARRAMRRWNVIRIVLPIAIHGGDDGWERAAVMPVRRTPALGPWRRSCFRQRKPRSAPPSAPRPPRRWRPSSRRRRQ